jgi:hypothetical protein
MRFIDSESAWTLEKNQYQLGLRFYQDGGALLGGIAGLTNEFTIGASYGGTGIVGTSPIEGNPEPAFALKYRLQTEEHLPFQLALGFNSQGYGTYYREGGTMQIDGEPYTCTRSFYQVNSKGFYVVATRRMASSRVLVNGGLNHSLEDDPGKSGITAFLGLAYELSPQLSIAAEYNNILHGQVSPEDIFEDPTGLTKPIRKAGGELNIGLTFAQSSGLSLRLAIKDITGVYSSSGNRIFQVFYQGSF